MDSEELWALIRPQHRHSSLATTNARSSSPRTTPTDPSLSPCSAGDASERPFSYVRRSTIASPSSTRAWQEATSRSSSPHSSGRSATRGCTAIPAKPATRLEAFELLEDLIRTSQEARKVVFIDELPWMDTPRSDLLIALESFWNGWVRQTSAIASCRGEHHADLDALAA